MRFHDILHEDSKYPSCCSTAWQSIPRSWIILKISRPIEGNFSCMWNTVIKLSLAKSWCGWFGLFWFQVRTLRHSFFRKAFGIPKTYWSHWESTASDSLSQLLFHPAAAFARLCETNPRHPSPHVRKLVVRHPPARNTPVHQSQR